YHIDYQSFGADAKYRVPTIKNRFGVLIQPPSKKSFCHLGFFAVKRRSVFILGAKCEAFHIAPRLFFMFLFLIPFTIRQHCIIYPHKFSTDPFSEPKGD
ncbi:MAG: hypothetical protein SO048_04795, partial [Sodaliphilus sp.]|nr:hypothetical protein [Sodaliphilus sp.]